MATPEQKNVTDLGQQAVALAEQLGRIAGTIEGTAEAWLNRQNRQSLTEQLTRVRDGAAEMLESLTAGAARGRKAAAESAQSLTEQTRQAAKGAASTTTSIASAAVESARRARTSATRTSKKKGHRAAARKAAATDPSHAPGKRHRKPAPSVHGVKKSDERIPKLRAAAVVRQRRKSYA